MTDFEFGEGLFDIFATEEDDNAPREHYDPSISRSLPSHLEERQKSNFVGLRNQYESCLCIITNLNKKGCHLLLK
jgi:hypothetical protein